MPRRCGALSARILSASVPLVGGCGFGFRMEVCGPNAYFPPVTTRYRRSDE